MRAPPPEIAIRDAIRHWSRLAELPDFAAKRHGFGNSDGGFGVTYPGDLDEYDRVTDSVQIPNGFVHVYGFWGLPNGYQLLVPESVYLTILSEMLANEGHSAEADRVRALLVSQCTPEVL